jgi:F-type H+-transporting ATPase subunit delta
VTNKTAATRYARALLDVAIQERANLDGIAGELQSFVDLFTSHPELQRVLLNPAVPVQRKRAAVADLAAAGRLSTIVAKLLVLLAERDRLVLLAEVLASYQDRLLDYQKVVRAEVTTAVPLSSDRASAIERSLGAMTGRTVRVATRVDPSIIGGVVARIGSTVYDGSVTRQLERLREKLAEGGRE